MGHLGAVFDSSTQALAILAPFWGRPGALLGSSWGLLGLSWALLGHSGQLLDRSWLFWAGLGLLLAVLGRLLAALGPLLGVLGPLLVALGRLLAALGALLAAFVMPQVRPNSCQNVIFEQKRDFHETPLKPTKYHEFCLSWLLLGCS